MDPIHPNSEQLSFEESLLSIPERRVTRDSIGYPVMNCAPAAARLQLPSVRDLEVKLGQGLSSGGFQTAVGGDSENRPSLETLRLAKRLQRHHRTYTTLLVRYSPLAARPIDSTGGG